MRAGRPATEGMRQTTLRVNQQTLSLSTGAVEAFRNSGLSGETASTEPGSARDSGLSGSAKKKSGLRALGLSFERKRQSFDRSSLRSKPKPPGA